MSDSSELRLSETVTVGPTKQMKEALECSAVCAGTLVSGDVRSVDIFRSSQQMDPNTTVAHWGGQRWRFSAPLIDISREYMVLSIQLFPPVPPSALQLVETLLFL